MIKYIVVSFIMLICILTMSLGYAQNASQQGQHNSKPHNPPYNDREVGGK